MKGKIFLIILLIIWMITVFGFSNQQGEESGSTSREVVKVIVNIISGINKMDDTQKEQMINNIEPFARKLAHFTIYLIGGLLIALNVYKYTTDDEKIVSISIILGAVYAVSDEIHQMFIARKSWTNT